MSQLFREVTADDGTVTYEVIEVADIPDETIREHDAFKGVLAESVARRQTIADLKKASEDSSDDKGDKDVVTPAEEKPKPTEPVVPVVPAYDEEATYKRFKERMVKERQEEQSVLTEREVMLNRIANDNNINVAVLRGGTEAELTEHAQLLAQEQLKFSEIGANANVQPPPIADVISATQKRFGWEDDDEYDF